MVRSLRVVVLVMAVAIVGCGKRVEPLTDEDRQPLVTADSPIRGPLLVHPTYHFSIKRPPASWVELPALATESNPDGRNAVYVYGEPDNTKLLHVGLASVAGDDRPSFERLIPDLVAAFQSAAKTARLTPFEITGTDGHLVATFRATMGLTSALVRVHQLTVPGKPPVIVSLTLVAVDPDVYADILDSFTP